MTVENPRCEYLVNPPAINAEAPRLSWELKSGRRGDIQTAYQIRVADSWEALRAGDKLLWDTGQVPSAETNQISYAGPKLASGQEVWWWVRAWDKEGHASKWSTASHWSQAPAGDDWHAKWISAPVPEDSSTHAEGPFTGLSWVWMPGTSATQEAPKGTQVFRKTFTVPLDKTVRHANFMLTADDQFQLFVNGKEAAKSDGEFEAWKRPVTTDVGSFLHPGENTLAISATNDGGAAGLAGILRVQLDPGDRVTVPIDATWKTTPGTPQRWSDVGADDSAWPDAAVLTAVGNAPWGVPGEARSLVLPPSPMLRKTFDADKPVRRATLRITALGLYDATLNGQKIGDAVFSPGWTDYRKRVYFQTYDVTPMVKQGSNTLDTILADGWACGYVGLGGRDRYDIGRPRLLARLDVEYADGSNQSIVSDDSWKSAYGPIREADLQMGETYDARISWPASEAGWRPAETRDDWTAPLEAYPGVPVRALAELPARHRTEPKPGHFVFDLGQNMVGWARLKVSGAAGTQVTLRFAEMLNPDGTVYTTNLRGARCIDTYTLSGNGTEVWEPRFTFHGFRYVEVTGYPGTPSMSAVTGVVAHSDTPPAGTFECSNSMVNKLYSNIVWGQRGNFLEVPTDCPQRDERLGWMGDAEVFVRTACANMDVSAFFSKWTVDVDDGQRADGAFPDVAPTVAAGYGTAAWGDAGVIVPWTVYSVYGDRSLLARNYPSMVRYIEYMEAHSQNLLRPDEGYGDWLSINADTPKDVLATAYFAHSTWIVAQAAQVLGNEADAARYTDLFNRIRAAYQQAYVGSDGLVKGNTQTAYVLSLAFDLMPQSLRANAAKRLADDIEKRGWHLSTGFVGTGLLNPTLTANGFTDVAYKLLLQDTFPGWGFSIKQGATTIWERWDGWTPDKGFQDPGMNSFNHYSFGAVGQWLFSTVAGIDTDGPGFQHIVIHPRPGGGMSHAGATYHSINGEIKSAWKLDDGFHLDVTVPANTVATVTIPAKSRDHVTEGDTAADQAEGVRYVRQDGESVVFEIGSGNYHFAVRN